MPVEGKAGDLAYIDSYRGLVPVKVTKVWPGNLVDYKVTAARPGYPKGYAEERARGNRAVPRKAVKSRHGRMRIVDTFYWLDDYAAGTKKLWLSQVKQVRGNKRMYDVGANGPTFSKSVVHFWGGRIIAVVTGPAKSKSLKSFGVAWRTGTGRHPKTVTFDKLIDAANYLFALQVVDAVEQGNDRAAWLQSLASDDALVMIDRVMSGDVRGGDTCITMEGCYAKGGPYRTGLK